MSAPAADGTGARFEPPDAAGLGRIVLDRPDDAVNALTPELIEALAAAVRAARALEGLRGLVVASGKPGQWIAGADLKLLTTTPRAAQLEATARRFQAVCDELAWLPCATVAAISGPALGGGFEVALACDYRVAAESPAVRIGLPEVSLGLIPAGGGTQRLPRLVGLARALDLILASKRLSARRAWRAGLLDELVHPLVLDQAARAWARRPKRPLDRPLRLGLSREAAVELAELTPAGRRLIYRRARQAVTRRTRGHYPAPLAALAAVEAGLERGLAEGLEAEARAFAQLATGPTARNLIWLFLAAQRQPSARARPVARLGVVGAGFMGAAIAEVTAAAGLPVRLRDVAPDAVAAGLATIQRLVDHGVARRHFDPRQGRAIVQRVSGTTDYSGFGAADLVVEAVPEELAVKQQVVRELEAVLRPGAVIASNTSALPIRELARAAGHPERVVGMHFFSPAQRMPLVEVVRGPGSADWAVATTVALANRLGKTVIVVGDGPGFYTSRVLGVMLNEAALLLAEGACIEEVDQALEAFGFPVGPCVLYDEVGLAVAEHAGETLARAFGGPSGSFPLATVVGQLVAAGATGKRSGRGFYLWPPRPSRRGLPIIGALPGLPPLGRPPARRPNPEVYRLLGDPPRRSFGDRAIQERLVLLFVNEAIRCLDEGVLRSPADGDLGAVLGLGFPPFLGGPFHYAEARGLAAVRDALARLAAAHGGRYQPAELLAAKLRQGGFYEGSASAGGGPRTPHGSDAT